MGKLSDSDSSSDNESTYPEVEHSTPKNNNKPIKLKIIKDANGNYKTKLPDSEEKLILKKEAKSILFYKIIPKIARLQIRSNRPKLTRSQKETEELLNSAGPDNEISSGSKRTRKLPTNYKKYFEKSESDINTSSSDSDGDEYGKTSNKPKIKKRRRIVKRIKRMPCRKPIKLAKKDSAASLASTVRNADSDVNWTDLSDKEDEKDTKIGQSTELEMQNVKKIDMPLLNVEVEEIKIKMSPEESAIKIDNYCAPRSSDLDNGMVRVFEDNIKSRIKKRKRARASSEDSSDDN